MTTETRHIAVCVCTYRRPRLLRRLLGELHDQDTNGRFTYSIVVADNDHQQSANGVVREFAATSSIPMTYCVEPRQSIPLARNKAIENASGEFIAFIDDDEFPTTSWLLKLVETCDAYHADGVLGPVKRHFDEEPPRWIVKGKFYERPTYPTGHVIGWREGRTNNVLLKRRIFADGAQPFRPEFLSGEDQDLFRRMIERGYAFVWCSEAVVYEVVPPIRWKHTFMLRRALLQGTVSVHDPTLGARGIAKSVIAVPGYTAALPFALALGHHQFMTLLVKLVSHIGRLLAILGIKPIKAYVTE